MAATAVKLVQVITWLDGVLALDDKGKLWFGQISNKQANAWSVAWTPLPAPVE